MIFMIFLMCCDLRRIKLSLLNFWEFGGTRARLARTLLSQVRFSKLCTLDGIYSSETPFNLFDAFE